MPIDMSPVLISIKVAVISTIIVFIFGTMLAAAMVSYRFPGQAVAETVIGLPMVLPPTVIGFGLLMVLGRHGPLGSLLENTMHIRVVFTWIAAVISAAVVSLPLMYRSARAALEGLDNDLLMAARTLGATEFRIFFTITLPLAWPGILAGILLSFARGLGEFGATLMLAGNIPGQTQTAPLAIFTAVESGDMSTAGWMVGIITALSFLITFVLNVRWSKKPQDRWSKRPIIREGCDRDARSGLRKVLT